MSAGRRHKRMEMPRRKRTMMWAIGAVVLLALSVAGCGGNNTTVSVTITGPAPSTTGLPVLLNGSVQLAATVSGISATSVFWQVCLPAAVSTTQPTNCTPAQGPTTCAVPAVSSPLSGYGTVTANGLYSAPSKVPSSNKVFVVATSCARPTAFGTYNIVIDSGFRVKITPTTATVAAQQSFQFNASVTGPSTSAVDWSVCQAAVGGGAPDCSASGLGSITPSGNYTAPATTASNVVVQAVVAADPTQSATAAVTVVSAVPPTIASIDPAVASAGSVQQDVYVSGTNFLSTEQVFVAPPGQQAAAVPTTFISASLLRATIPASELVHAGTMQVSVATANGTLSGAAPSIEVFAVRPSLIASSPDSVPQTNVGGTSANVSLTGGFFSSGSNGTTATFNGAAVPEAISSSRQMSVTVPPVQIPGLYPLVVQNTGVASGEPSLSGLNLAVTPQAGSGVVVGNPVSVGTNPTAVAIDEADGVAVVANTGSNTVSLVNLVSGTTVGSPISVGQEPTGVAVDDLLPHPVALVVNSADQTVTAIDLTTRNESAPLNVSISAGANPPLPYSIGINPLTPQLVPNIAQATHRAIVAYQSSNQATVLDVSLDLSAAGGTPVLSDVGQVGSGTAVSFSTGQHPSVAIDPRLNWAVITPGGAGTINVVDLGRDAASNTSPGAPPMDVGRAPEVIATLSIATTVQGIGINPETHTVLLTDPVTGALSTFNFLDNTVTTVTNPCGSSPCTGTPFNVLGFGAAAADPLENVGIAVNSNNGTAVIVDLENSVALQTITGLGSSPAAVAVDPVSNRAVVVNQGDGTVSIVSLASTINPVQVVQANPPITYTSSAPVTLTLTGSFPSGAVARLDQTPLSTTPVAATCTGSAPVVCRQLDAVVPANMLSFARRYVLDVQNTANSAVSNVTDFTVVQPVAVGKSPVGVAVDTDRDLAVVTNSGDGTVSLVSLAPNTPESPLSLGPVGLVGSPINVGANPEGVAVLPRLHLAVVADNGSNDASVVDVTGATGPSAITLCGTNCTGPTGVAINDDTATAAVTNTNTGSAFTQGSVSFFPVSPSSSSTYAFVDQDPVAAAVDPTLDYAAIATDSSSSTIDFLDMSTQAKVGGVSGASVANPSGITFDPVNQVFLAVDSLLNNVLIVNPATFLQTPVAVGIAPTSIAYNFQTSTLVTVNGPSHTMSVLAYVCPPTNAGPPTCAGPRVQTVLGLGGAQTSLLTLGPNAVAIDPRLNLAAVVDPDNNQLLLVPLPY